MLHRKKQPSSRRMSDVRISTRDPYRDVRTQRRHLAKAPPHAHHAIPVQKSTNSPASSAASQLTTRPRPPPRNATQDDEIPSELYDTSTSRFSDASLFRRSAEGHDRTHFPWRTTFVAVVLFGIGLTFLLLGALHFRDKDRGASIAFICIGCVTFIPGAYVAFNLVQVLRGAPGFHLSQFAHWDDYRW